MEFHDFVCKMYVKYKGSSYFHQLAKLHKSSGLPWKRQKDEKGPEDKAILHINYSNISPFLINIVLCSQYLCTFNL